MPASVQACRTVRVPWMLTLWNSSRSSLAGAGDAQWNTRETSCRAVSRAYGQGANTYKHTKSVILHGERATAHKSTSCTVFLKLYFVQSHHYKAILINDCPFSTIYCPLYCPVISVLSLLSPVSLSSRLSCLLPYYFPVLDPFLNPPACHIGPPDGRWRRAGRRSGGCQKQSQHSLSPEASPPGVCQGTLSPRWLHNAYGSA